MRASGILMHISSLPGSFGIGTMGKQAYKFVDFLESAGQSYWQVLPLSPTGYGDSPYQSFSAFAGNPYLIDLDTLCVQNLLRQEEIEAYPWGGDPERVDYGALFDSRTKLLGLATKRFFEEPPADFAGFLEENQFWLPDYALFMALKERFGGENWRNWEEEIRLRKPEALAKWREALECEIRLQYFIQYVFRQQWDALHAYAAEKKIKIIGDVPIYVPLDSADVWANPELFQLDETLRPIKVAGVPPDGFTADGQLWGNPLYDWETHQKTGFAWWKQRLLAAASLYDCIRLDHFRGFESYWAVPAEDDTARNGAWEKGPGMDFLEAVRTALPDYPFIAEDLGYLTPEVHALREASGYPGMKILEFAFDSGSANVYLPHNHVHNAVCYTGTHDNQTLCQWLEESAPETMQYAREYLGLNKKEGYAWGVLRAGFSSVCDLFIAQMQDFLELGGESRMNFPGTTGGNWTWRMAHDALTPELAARILALTLRYGRCRQ